MSHRTLGGAAVWFLVGAAACRNVELPGPAGPGSVQGTMVYAQPGRTELLSAPGGTVSLLGSGVGATSDEAGRFFVGHVTQTHGALLFSSTIAGVTRQKVLRVEDLGAGPGRDLVLGEVALSRNAVVRGRVFLGASGTTGGLGQTTAFVPGGPWAATTGDDGTFQLSTLPEGALQVAFFHDGYAVASTEVTLGGGDERVLRDVVLTALTKGPAAVKGKVRLSDGSAATNATARYRTKGAEQPLTVSASGDFSQGGLAAGLYQFAFERPGSRPVVLYNVLLDEGETDLGVIELLDGTGERVDLRQGDPTGQPDGGTGQSDGGTRDGGSDAGSRPIASASGPALVAPGSTVTLTGSASTGTFPLVYHWAQLRGPPVTLSVNNAVTAHSPTFTAPASGAVLDFALTVEDPAGVMSDPAPVSVAVGLRPVARFTPDSGTLVYGSQAVPLRSTSFDDGGLALISYEWALAAGTTGSLDADGGPTATWYPSPIAFGDPDVLAAITLRVKNAVGATSALATNYLTVRGVNPNNWSLDAGTNQLIAVGPVPPQVQLSGSVTSALVSNPSYSVAWSCTPSLGLINGDTLTPRFVAPTIVGPTVTATCTLTATGAPPLDPATLTATTNVLLRDATAPTVMWSSVEATRTSRFGMIVVASEPLSAATFSANCSPSIAFGYGVRLIYSAAIAGTNYNTFVEGGSCSAFTVDLTDTAQFTNSSSNVPFGNASTISTVWVGPYVSTSSSLDPRPVVSTLSQMPGQVQLHERLMPGLVPGFEVLATSGSNLVQLTGLDLSARPTCEPSCDLVSSATAATVPAGAPVTTNRSTFGGAELFFSTTTDGGVAPAAARRSPSGSWSTYTGLTGTPGNWGLELRTARVDATGRLLIDTWSPALNAFTTTDVAATGLSEVGAVATGPNVAAAAVGPTKSLLVRKRNPTDLSWSTFTIATPPTNITSLRSEVTPSGVAVVAVESPAGLVLVRTDTAGSQTISTSPVTGYDIASWGTNTYIVYAQNGDLRFKTIAGSVWSGAGGGPVDVGGPPRTGYSPPYPVVLDANPACEAAWPSLAFVEEALVITWQERCAPATDWKVVARVMR